MSNIGWWKSLLQRVFRTRHKARNGELGGLEIREVSGQTNLEVVFSVYDEQNDTLYEAIKLCNCGAFMYWIEETEGMQCLHCDDVCVLKDCDYCVKFVRSFDANL